MAKEMSTKRDSDPSSCTVKGLREHHDGSRYSEQHTWDIFGQILIGGCKTRWWLDSCHLLVILDVIHWE